MRVVVVGAGIVGAATAYAAAEAGLDVVVLDRAGAASGTTSHGEGNLLLSDKAPGPELEHAKRARDLWDELGDRLGATTLELEAKGGLVVATHPTSWGALEAFASAQRGSGVVAEEVADIHDLEPHLAADLRHGVHYPQDAQVQPVRATTALLSAARDLGAQVRLGVAPVVAAEHTGSRLTGLRLADGEVVAADRVVNAAGPWGGRLSESLGVPVPVLPRRGFVLVTEPLPPLVHRKVYSAAYVGDVASSDESLQTSVVVEGTPAGTILVGASRERVGFDPSLDVGVLRRLADQACRLYPALRAAALLRAYRGFRPYCPDHLPVVGPDPRDPAVLHACGHEGAGIGLAPATAELVTAYLTGADPESLPGAEALRPDRLVEVGR